MISYIPKVISKQEKLIMISRLHWIYLVEGVFWLAALTWLGFWIEHYIHMNFGGTAWTFHVDLRWIRFDEQNTPYPWLLGICGFMIFWILLLKYIATEIGITDQRIIYKRGLIFVEVQQLDHEDIRGESVIHGWLGWLLGYGRIHLDCRFINDVFLPAVKNPYDMVKASHIARMRHPVIDYTAEELELNLDEIEERKKKAAGKLKLKQLKRLARASFRKSS